MVSERELAILIEQHREGIFHLMRALIAVGAGWLLTTGILGYQIHKTQRAVRALEQVLSGKTGGRKASLYNTLGEPLSDPPLMEGL